ncbi:MAG: peptidoglycan-binding protein, partial [Alphaproteobacteria bacterium]|nr:peptidoglycan-binding protein [Alphaproteobacteria bacterium]
SRSTATPEYLALAFLACYERPSDPNQPIRATQARFWWDYLTDVPPTPPTPPVRVQNTKNG